MSSLQNIELKTRKRAMQDVGSSSGGGGGADSGTSSRGRKSKSKKRNNNGNKSVSGVRSDKVAASTPTPNGDNHSPQASSKSGLQIQTRRRQEQQKQRQQNESNTCSDECDTLVGNISGDYDPRQCVELATCTIATNESPILPIVLAESNVVVQIQPDQSPIEVSRENVNTNTNNRAQDHCLLDREDAHDVGQTSQATRLLINSEQSILADLQASSSSSSNSSQFTKQRQQQQQQQKQSSASSKLIETQAGTSEKLHSESKLAGNMNQTVLVQVDEDERANNNDDGELYQLVGRKSSQSSSGHASSGANSSSCWSTPVLQNSRRCSSVFAISDLKSNSKCDINKNGHSNNDNDNKQQQQQFMPTTLATAILSHQDGAELQQEVASSLIKRSSSETDCGGGGGGSGRGAIFSTNCNGQAKVSSQRWRKATARQQPIKRTISRSMLEFDSSLGANERFVVYWKNLTFAYKPGLFARLSRGGGGGGGDRNKATATATEASLSPQQWPDYQNSNVVLNNVSGTIKSNQLVAIIGPSGCGKTTLLQFLAGNNGHQQDRLRIRGLGEPKVAFIGQDDTLLPGLTARETLMYASRLQNNAAGFDHAGHIQPILSELGLLECANRCVSKLSGGQAKRVTIGQELLYPTNLLILDEVTSGLDATTSLSIVKLLKYLVSDCSYPMSIVISIHQPSARLFAVFDKVYVMSAGNCLYEGSCNLTTINNHLSKFNLKCPRYHNMADYLIELASSLNGDDQQQQQQQQQQDEPDDDSDSNYDAQLAGKQYEVKLQTMIDKQDRQANGAHQCRRPSLTTRSHSNKRQESLSCNSTVLNQMIAVQRKQSQRWIEELESGTSSATASVTETVTDTMICDNDDDHDSDEHDDDGDDEHDDDDGDDDDGDDDATNGLIAGGGGGTSSSTTIVDTSLYLAIERAREQRLKPFMAHFRIHFERSLKRTRRSYILTYLQLIAYVIVGIQTATFYGPDIGLQSGCPSLPGNLMSWILSSNSDGDGDGDGDGGDGGQMGAGNEIRRIQENMNFLLVAVLTSTFAALEITVITFPLEAKTVKREWRNGWYRVTSYFMGRTLADLPLQVAFVMIFCALIYTLTGQLGLTSWRFAYFVLIVVMTALVAQSIGLIFGALFMNNLPAAVFTAPLAIFPSLLFSGFFSRVSQVPAFYVPLTYLSHFRYAFDALLVTLYGFNRCNCDQATLSNYHASLANQTSSMRDMFHLLFGASDCISGSGSGSATDSNPVSSAMVSSAAIESNDNAHSGDNTIADSSDGGGGVISHDDLAAISASNQSLGSTLMSMIKTGGSTTTLAPAAAAADASSLNLNRQHPATSGGGAGRSFSASETYKQFEDMIVDTIFQQMSSSTPPPSSSGLLTNSSSLAAPTNDTLLMGNSTDGSGGGGGGGGGESTSVMDRLADKFATKLTGLLNRQSNFGHSMPTKCSKFNSYLITEFDLSDDNLEFNLWMLFVAVLLTRLMCNVILHFTIATRIR